MLGGCMCVCARVFAACSQQHHRAICIACVCGLQPATPRPAVMVLTELRNTTALGNRLTGLPHNKPAAGEVSFVYLFRQSQQRYQMFDALKYVLGPCF